MSTLKHRLTTTWELEINEVPVTRFVQLVMERGFEHVSSDSWPTERNTLEGLLELALSTFRSRTNRTALLDLTEPLGRTCVAHVSLWRGTAYIRLAARDVDTLTDAKQWLRQRYPVAQPEEEQQISVTFWSMSNYARQMTRTIDVPAWADVAANYAAAARNQLASLMAFESRLERGQLVLWHGPPGTGKTHALRALGWEWRNWCRLHYVTDPETFFGSNAAYMLDVLLDDDEDEDDSRHWRLLVLEDTGELLAADAKAQTGQGLSRLLNVVDGLIGQGLRVAVLVTTNESLRGLHPAVSRPGRCAAQIEFAPFDAEEARDWLAERGVDADPGQATLASLFALAGGIDDVPEQRRVGFIR
jgi:ATPase family protein associated with various cellular activities (AAA)